MKHAMPQISEAELEVMKALWTLGEASSQQLIEAITPNSEWKPKTIQTLLTRLVKKGAVGVDMAQPRAYLYQPRISEAAYRAHANQSFLQRVYGGSVQLLLSQLVRERKLSEADIEALRALIDEEEQP